MTTPGYSQGSPYPTQAQYNTQYDTQYGMPTSGTTVVVAQPSPFILNMQFRETPVRIKCQFCQADVVTATHHEVGTLAWIACFILFVVGCILCFWVPFVMKAFKDVVHTCPQCHRQVGRYSRM